MGDLWIKVDNTKLGVIRPFNADLNLAVETPLYDHPYREAANGANLSPQTVHAKAEFVSPSGFYAIQIETSWLGDQWLIQPEISNGIPEPLTFPDAISPDYRDTITIKNMRVVRLGERTFVQGKLVLQKEAWEIGRFKPWGKIPVSGTLSLVSGKLSIWNSSGDVITQVPYAVYSNAGESLTTSLFLPVNEDLSSSVLATLQDTIPTYFGLPVPPLPYRSRRESIGGNPSPSENR